ncbi:MAG: hypothetical protein ACLFM1_09560 [Bacteroidales bacterium]
MKKFIIFFSSMLLLIGCRSYHPMMMEPETDPIDPKLPAMQLYSGDEYQNQLIDREEFHMFREEMETNIMNPYGDKYGSAFYSSRILKSNGGWGWFLASGLTLYTINLLGFPMMLESKEVEVEVRIVDLQGRLIGKYSGRGKGQATYALYFGYDVNSAYRKILNETVGIALEKVREKIRADSERLRTKLLESEAVPVEE